MTMCIGLLIGFAAGLTASAVLGTWNLVHAIAFAGSLLSALALIGMPNR